jgi:hypothetical protein
MDKHSITPPPELVARLWREASAGRDDAPIGEIFSHGVYLAYRAGADQELEACCHCFARDLRESLALELRARRRPKPPSLKEQALKTLQRLSKDGFPCNYQEDSDWDTIRRALEALPE